MSDQAEMVSFKPLIEGEKKYSPPRGTMKVGMGKMVCSALGSRPDISRRPWPMSGSKLFGTDQNLSSLNLEDGTTYPGSSGWVSNGGNLLLLAQAVHKVRSETIFFRCPHDLLTLLKELEAIHQAALVSGENQSTAMLCPIGPVLIQCHFGTKLDSSTHDTPELNGDGRNRGWRNFKIIPWVRLSDMGGEWATKLRIDLASEEEIVVSDQHRKCVLFFTKGLIDLPLGISCKNRVILERRKINGGTYASSKIDQRCRISNANWTYRSSSGPPSSLPRARYHQQASRRYRSRHG